ncbi:PP2C family protein-serine/threonine phosphatase [Flexivirga caeni]|uniref:Serine/threonine-protein phosphatase n=1 Tax=Flexivirga caeni TaxID=2294115 RepID=A0A3M9M9N3_9MICO|nr:protein phosphatase 2C domain-containing protein [Flexivirga caeni]RNI22281.1 serine/threonine-protein phosphatase [Flexivirga caeni]
MTADPAMRLRWGAASDRGLHRAHNEDAYLAAPPVFVVADGMGGHAQGDRASRAVIAAFVELVGSEFVSADRLDEAVREAGAAVARLASATAAPGSTVAGAVLARSGELPCWLVFNVGDSRSYLLSPSALEQVSVDHSRLQQLLDRGELAPEDAAGYGDRHVITNALGAGIQSPRVDRWLIPASSGERLLVCSDGLTDELTDTLIEATLRAEPDPQVAAETLVAQALDAGGHDNVTVLVVDAVRVDGPVGVIQGGDITVPDLETAAETA